MRSASLRALPFLRGRLLWTRWGLLHRTQLGGLPHSGLGDEARDVLRGRHVEGRSEEHTSELQSRGHLVCRLLLEKKKARRSAPRPFTSGGWPGGGPLS